MKNKILILSMVLFVAAAINLTACESSEAEKLSDDEIMQAVMLECSDVPAPEPEEVVEPEAIEEPQAEEEQAVPEETPPVVEKPVTLAGTSISSGSVSGSRFKFIGVIDENGWHYTWYSSNKAYHKNTAQWTPDSEGIYRDSAGYVVVACEGDADGNQVRQGALVPTPFGTGKVYDSGCAYGTIDIYTCF